MSRSLVILMLINLITLSHAFALAPKARLRKASIESKRSIVGKTAAIQSGYQWQFLDFYNKTDLGNRITQLRRSMKKTQKGLADEFRWTRQWINMGEQSQWNNPRAKTLLDLVNYFRVTLFYLVTGRESSQPFRRLQHSAIRANLARLRAEQGISPEELEDEIDVNSGWVSKVEAGQLYPSLTTLMRLSRFFREPLDDFFVEKDEFPIEDKLLAFSL